MVLSSPDINKLLEKEVYFEMMEKHTCFQCNMKGYLEMRHLQGAMILVHNLWVKNLPLMEFDSGKLPLHRQ